MHRPIVDRQSGRLSVDCRPTIGRLSVDSRPIVGRLSTDYRPIVGRQSTDIAAAISTEATYSTHDPIKVVSFVSRLQTIVCIASTSPFSYLEGGE